MSEPFDLPTTPPPEPRSVRSDVVDRTSRAWAARLAGASWTQAAEVAGYTDEANCRRAVRSVFGELPKVEREDLRHLWRDRLELVWRQVVRDMHEKVPGSVVAAVRVAQAAARLDGLDAPSRVTLIDPTQEEIERFITDVLGPRHSDLEADIFEDAEAIEVEIIE